MENLPVIYGEMGGGKGGGGHTPVEAADTLSSKQTMRLLFALSEGQIDSVEDILVNSASISNYSSTIDYEVRQGTVDQTVIKGFSEVEAPLTGGGVFPVELKAGIQHIYSLLGMYDAARINLTIPRLMQVTGEGDRVGYTVTLSVYKRHQPFGGSPGSWQLASTITKNGKCTNPYSWDVRLEKPATTGELDSWGIMIVRDSADDSDDKHYSTTALSAITTIVESSLTYPHTALVGVTLKDAAQFGGSIPEIKFKVKGIKLPLPVNYNPTTRAYTGVWNGAFKSVREYTDNLAWITYWVLREHGSTFLDSEWGLEIAASDIDVGSFYLYAQYCDQLVSDGKGGQEPRYTAHFQFIERDNVPTFLTYLLNLGNANFSSNSLGQISIIWDGAGQSITKVVSNATVVDGVFEYSSNDLEGRTNLVNVTYAREELFGDSDTATHYEQTLIDRYGLQTSDVVLFGCKSEAQALRKARAVLYNNCYATDLVTFRQLFQGATYQIGELVSVMDSDNVVTDPKHGIIIDSSLTAGTTTLALDRSIVLTNASYTVQFIGADGTTFLSKAITQTNGSFSSVSYTGSEIPFVGGTVLFSTTALTPRTVKVIKVDKDDEHVYTITGLTHNESKYSYIETVGTLPTPSGSFINFNNFTVPAVSNITVDEVFSSNGVVEFSKLAVDWDWNVSGTEDYRATFDVSYRRDNQEYQQARNLGTSDFDIEYPLPGVYEIYVWAVNPFSGLRSVVTSVVYNFRVASATSTLLPPTNVVVPNTAGVVFQQRDLPLTWTFPVVNDTKVDKLKDYVVQVLDYATSTVKGTYTVAPNTDRGGDFLLTFAENAAIFGTAQRQFRVRVFSRDLVGDLSNYVEVVPNNPAPTVSTFAVSAVFGAAYVKATIPSDPDLVSYTFKKYSAATGGTLLGTITTVSNYVDFEATAGTEYFYTVTPNDSFGTGTESTRTASTALSVEVDTYTYTGLQFTPNSPANNYIAWSSFVAIKNGSTNVTVNAGNAQWTAGTLYLYYIPGDTTFHSTTSATTAIAAGGRILATYKGGTEITADAGKAFISGDQLLAGTVGANQLSSDTLITNKAQIGNVLESSNYVSQNNTYAGWKIDKEGHAEFSDITIRKTDGTILMASNAGIEWGSISGDNKPEDNATNGATFGTPSWSPLVYTFPSVTNLTVTNNANIKKTASDRSLDSIVVNVSSANGQSISFKKTLVSRAVTDAFSNRVNVTNTDGNFSKSSTTAAWDSFAISDAGYATEAEIEFTKSTTTIGLPVTFVSNVLINGTTLTKESPTSAYDSQVCSAESYAGGCTVRFKAGQTIKQILIGINSDPLTDASYTSLDYAFYLNANGYWYTYESNVNTMTGTTYSVSDIFEIVYSGTTVVWKINGVVKRTVTTTANRTFYLDSSFYEKGASVNSVEFLNSVGQSPTLTLRSNVYLDGNQLKKAFSNNSWDSHAYSAESYQGNCYLKFYAGSTTGTVMAALNSDPATDASYSSLDYAIECYLGIWYIYESGSQVLTGAAYTTNTKFEIKYSGTTIEYFVDGISKRIVTTTAGRTFFLDTSFYNTASLVDIVWTQNYLASQVDLRTDPLLTVQNLTNGFAFYGGDGTNTYEVYHNGSKVNNAVVFSNNTKFNIVYSGGSIIYKVNGVVVNTSTLAGTPTLFSKLSFYRATSTINSVKFSDSILKNALSVGLVTSIIESDLSKMIGGFVFKSGSESAYDFVDKGVVVAASGSYSSADTFTVEYLLDTVKWYKNSVLLRTSTVSGGLATWLKAYFYYLNEELTNISGSQRGVLDSNVSGQLTKETSAFYIANAAINSAQIGSIALVGTSNFSVKSGTAGARMMMDNNVIKVYDSSGVLRVKLGNLSA
jgi:predicted phage tail protein